MDQTNDELQHHGIKGMKWGHRKQRRAEIKKAKTRRKNLEKAREVKKEKAQTAAELAANKKKILESRNAKEIYNNRHMFSSDELMEAYKVLNTEANIKKLIPEEKNKVERVMDSYVKWGKKITDVANTSINAYNTANKFLEMVGVNAPKADGAQAAAKAAKDKMDKTAAKSEKEKAKQKKKNDKQEQRTQAANDRVRNAAEQQQRNDSGLDDWMNTHFQQPSQNVKLLDQQSRKRRRRRK